MATHNTISLMVRAKTGSKLSPKVDLSNGFENRTVDYERSVPNVVSVQQVPSMAPDYSSVSQPGVYPTPGRLAQPLPEDRQQQQYQDKSGLEHHVSQTATQTLPVQIQPHFVPDFVPDQSQSQYPQARGQFEVRSQMYNQQGQYGDRVGYVTRDVTYRDSSLYAHAQGTGNPVFTGANAGYVTVQHASQLQHASQSVSPQPGFYPGVIMTAQPSVSQSYGQFAGQSQYTYGQYPQTLINPIPYNPHAPMYTAQQFNQQTSPNPQRYSQEVSQYQGQPIIQSIAQNVIAPVDRSVNSSTTRGPKPMVPPRINSKISSDAGNRKSITEIPVAKPVSTTANSNANAGAVSVAAINASTVTGIGTANAGVNQSAPPVSQESATPISVSDSRSFSAPVNQTPRTRQDGLYIDSSGDQSMRDTIVDTIPNDCLYVSRNEHRKSVSDVTTASFPRRNDTITFTFPGDTGDTSLLTARKPPSGLSDKKWTADNMSQIFQTDNKRDPVLRVATVPYDRQENRKSVMSDITNRKPEWGNVSPNQRPNPVIAQENRRSDYFEEHRRSPMPVIDQKRMDDLRRSPMPFISVRDSSCERVAQNSPSYPIPANQNFEKTRQELVIWAEQRQRHEVERTMHPNPIFATSPRSRNPSEERRVMIPLDEQRNKDIRVPQVAFQPIPNISQNTIMEQRRHLRHVSADLTKHMELSRKDFEDQPISGSVANLGPGVSTSSSQRASPNLCHQFPAMSEAKLDTKTLLTVVTDFPGDNPMKPLEQTDHIIHSHKKSHNISACLLTHSKSQVENLQSGSGLGDIPDKTECNHSQQQQQHQQQSLDMIAEKLSQFERQQSDLQARLQCLQNQNHLLDQVAHHQYQHQQSDLQSRLQCLQDRQATEKSLRQAIELQQKNAFNDMHHMQMKALADQVIDQQQQQQHQPGEPLSKQMMDQHLLNRNSAYLSAGFTNQMCQSLTSERLSPRIQVETELERSQITLPTNSQFERNDGTRGSHQYRLMCQSADATDNIVASCPSSASSCSSSNTINVTSGASATGVTFSGTLKKVPPEKPPRTSLIVQSPETESNRSQPAIGLKHTPKARTSLSVKSSVVTKEEVTVARAGKVVDERSRETKDNNYYTSSTSEIWEPVGIIHRPSKNIKPFDSSDDSRPNSNASSDQGYTTNNSSTNVLRERGGAAVGCPICEDNDPDCARRCLGGLAGLGSKVPGVQTTTSAPTIFGTVASDLNPKDGNSRRSLPQTPAGGVGGKGLGSGCGAGTGPGMVNGGAVDHQDIRDGVAINTEHALVYRDGNLVSGSLEALVQHMVPTEDYYPDRAYLFAFLLSARLFIKPHELLGEVCALCEHQQNLNGEGGKERLQRFVPRLVQLLAEWTETFPYDFRDERVMGHVRSITQKVAAVDAAARQEVSALLQNLLLRLTALERYEEGLSRLATEAATEQLTQVDVTELCPSATVLAQQLTHVELERLSYIGPEEFVQAFAKESPHLETSFKDMKKTRNLESYVQWFNRLSYFVATEVCKHAKKKQRVRVVEYWIETARECFNIGNFNSLMAIIAGLNMSPISRLKKTWSKVQSAKFSILEHQMDPSSNFSSYRSTLKAAMWRSVGATDERQRIVVPFFSLLVKDLYFLNEGCSNKLPNGHINFEKFWQLAKQVTEFIAWKQVACPFEKNSRVIAFLQASPVLTENALALASFECEPPDNNPEKERYKALKSDLNAQ